MTDLSRARAPGARVATLWLLESALIGQLNLPLNLDQNKHSRFHERLSAARALQKGEARRLPVLPN